MEDFRIIISQPHTVRKNRFMERADRFCTECYWNCRILAHGEQFDKPPAIYFVAVGANNQIVGTLGVFFAPLPLAEIFNFKPEPYAMEFGRLSLKRSLSRSYKVKVVKQLILTTVEFFGDCSFPAYIETYKKVYNLVGEAIGIGFLTETHAEIIEKNIPWKSREFYLKRKPRIYRINSSTLKEVIRYETGS